MSEELEFNGSTDVTESTESSPVAEKASSEHTSESHSAQAVESSSKPETKEPPFHEHPRFKEIINQRNELTSQYQESQKAIQELKAQLESLSKPKTSDPKSELRERLKNVDPVFAEEFSRLLDSNKELEDLKSWKSQFERQNYIQSARSAIDQLKGQLKVDNELHEMYIHRIPANIPIEKMAEIYKSQHETMSKFLEARERAALSKYTSAKKSDSQIPAPSKGSPAKMAPNVPNKTKLSKDPEQARAQLVSKVRAMLRADTE